VHGVAKKVTYFNSLRRVLCMIYGLIGLQNFQSLVNLSKIAGGSTKPGEAR
jgi:hypothetical protein